MKTTLFSIFLSLLTLAVAAQPTDYAGYWPFNGSADDETATYNGAVLGATPTTDFNNNPESAFLFDGTDDYIDIGVVPLYQEMSYSFWLKRISQVNNPDFIIGHSYGGNYTQITIRDNRIHYVRYQGGWYDSYWSNTTITDNIWYHVCVTINQNSEVKMYINGTEGTSPASAVVSVHQGNFEVGRRNRITDIIYSNIAMDDLKFYTRILTQQEVYDLSMTTPPAVEETWESNGDNIYFTNGQVSIGRTTPIPGYELSVDGEIISREVKITIDGWSDFVFAEDYILRPLDQLEKHIREHGHLPDIPSEEEVVAGGINLGEMNAKLLQKIEELTLYIIELKKENEAQNKIIQQIKEAQKK